MTQDVIYTMLHFLVYLQMNKYDILIQFFDYLFIENTTQSVCPQSSIVSPEICGLSVCRGSTQPDLDATSLTQNSRITLENTRITLENTRITLENTRITL